MASSMSRQDEANPTLRLATRAGKMVLSCPLRITHCVLQENISPKAKWPSLFGQDGLILTSFFSCEFIHLHSILANNIQPSWLHAWSITQAYTVLYVWIVHIYARGLNWLWNKNRSVVQAMVGRCCWQVPPRSTNWMLVNCREPVCLARYWKNVSLNVSMP